MPHHSEHRPSRHSTRQLFDLVADIERYPEFIPWVTGARILRREGNEIWAELAVRFKGFSGRYSSEVHLVPPEGTHSTGEIHVTLLEGPFTHLTNHWRFEPLTSYDNNDDKAMIHFDIDFAFRSTMLDKMIGVFFEKAVQKMVRLFETRADTLYL